MSGVHRRTKKHLNYTVYVQRFRLNTLYLSFEHNKTKIVTFLLHYTN